MFPLNFDFFLEINKFCDSCQLFLVRFKVPENLANDKLVRNQGTSRLNSSLDHTLRFLHSGSRKMQD